MADNDPRADMAQMDQALFGETQTAEAPQAPQAAPQGETPALGDLFAAAGLEAPVPADQPPAEPAPQMEAPAVQEPGEVPAQQEPSQQEVMQTYMQRQQQLNEQLAQQQQQYQQTLYAQQQQQHHPQQPNYNDPRELAEMMTTVGLDPTSATDVYMFRSDMERRQNQTHYQDQITQMQDYINTMHNQNQHVQTESALAPQVDATLKVYGEIPAEIADNIKAQAATILSENLGNATEAQAIQWATEPYLPLLKMVRHQGTGAQAPVAQQPGAAKPNANAQAVMAAALSGGSSGHGPTLEDIDITQLEKALFRNN